MQQNIQQYNDIMKQQVPFPQRIIRVVELNYNGSKNMSVEFLKDVYNDKSGLAKKLAAAQQDSREVFKKDLKAAQRKGWIRKDYKIEFIMYMLNSLNEKIMDEKFVSMFKDVQDAIMESTNFFFYGLMAKEDERE